MIRGGAKASEVSLRTWKVTPQTLRQRGWRIGSRGETRRASGHCRRLSGRPQPLTEEVETRFEHVIPEGFGVGQEDFNCQHARGLGREGRDLHCGVH